MAVDPASAATLIQAVPALVNLAEETGGGFGTMAYDMLPESWGKGRDFLGGLTATLTGGPFGLKGYHTQRKAQAQQDKAQKLIDSFMSGGKSYVNPGLISRAQLLAGGGQGRDPLVESTARRWLSGEGGIPYDTNLANQLLRGDIPPSVAAAMDRQLGTRFDRLRRNQGSHLARSGILRSSVGGRLMGDAYDSERMALSDAYINTLLQRQQLGLGILNSASADRRALMGMGANELQRLSDRDLAYQNLGFQVLSDADRRKHARETFGLNAQLGLLGQQQARRDAALESSGNILSNLYTNYQDQQRFDKILSQQGDQFSQLMKLSGGENTSPIQAKADLSAISVFAPDSVMSKGNRFKTLGESRTGAGGYGARNTPLTSRY